MLRERKNMGGGATRAALVAASFDYLRRRCLRGPSQQLGLVRLDPPDGILASECPGRARSLGCVASFPHRR